MSDLLKVCQLRRGYPRTTAHNDAETKAVEALKALNATLVGADPADEADFDAFASDIGAIFRNLGPDDERVLADQINRTLRAFQHAEGDFTVATSDDWEALCWAELARLEVEVFTAIARDPGLAINGD